MFIWGLKHKNQSGNTDRKIANKLLKISEIQEFIKIWKVLTRKQIK